MNRPIRRATLFPYTTLFRSETPFKPRHRHVSNRTKFEDFPHRPDAVATLRAQLVEHSVKRRKRRGAGGADIVDQAGDAPRSEEHTSELQSRLHLVCRPLLAK